MNRMFIGQGIQKAAISGARGDPAQGIKLKPVDGRAERGQIQP